VVLAGHAGESGGERGNATEPALTRNQRVAVVTPSELNPSSAVMKATHQPQHRRLCRLSVPEFDEAHHLHAGDRL